MCERCEADAIVTDIQLPDEHVVHFINAPSRVVRGLRVGPLFIRTRVPSEMSVSHETGNRVRALDWVIDVESAQRALMTLHTFPDALLFADDVCRFAARDIGELATAQTFAEVERILGRDMLRWCEYFGATSARGMTPLGFRAWFAEARGFDYAYA